MTNKIIKNFVMVWVVLNLLSFPFVFAEDNKEVSKSVFYNGNDLGYFGKVSIVNNEVNNNEIATKEPILAYFAYYLILILAISAVKINSKAQIQMGESIAVLFIFLVLLGLGSIFMVNVMSGSAVRTREENLQLKSIDIAQKISFLPELQCGEENIVIEPCIDLLKLNATANVTAENPSDYYPIFEYSTIEVREIFPDPDNNWTLYHKHPGGKADQKQIHLPTALYNPVEKTYNFGWVVVKVYS